MARPALRLELQLFRGAADALCHRKLPDDGGLHPRRYARAPAQRGHGRGDRALDHRRGHRAVGGRMPCRCGLRQRAGAGASGDLRDMALRAGPQDRGDERGFWRAGAADGRLRADGAVLRSARRIGGRRLGFEAAGHAGRVGTDVFQRHGRAGGREHDLRGRGHARLPSGVLPREPDPWRRPDRSGAALRARDRGGRRHPRAGSDARGLP